MVDSKALPNRRSEYLLGFGLLILVAVIGLYIAKWSPYWDRGFVIAATHTYPGQSILSGKAVAPPAPSFEAAITYGRAYFLAIWQALVVGLLLAATIETVVPKDWIVRVLGSTRFRSSFLGGVLALPGMM